MTWIERARYEWEHRHDVALVYNESDMARIAAMGYWAERWAHNLIYELERRMPTPKSTESRCPFCGTELQSDPWHCPRCQEPMPSTSVPPYDKNFGDDRLCQCGHEYYRHFDTYDGMAAVGCKYCDCFVWQEPMPEPKP